MNVDSNRKNKVMPDDMYDKAQEGYKALGLKPQDGKSAETDVSNREDNDYENDC